MAQETITPTQPARKLLGIRTFMAEYGQARSTTFALIGKGALEAVKVGRRTFIVAESAERWRTSLPRAR